MADEPLLTDGVGAGNFFRTAAAAAGGAAEASVIELDRAYHHPDGRVLREFTLSELDELTDRVAAGYHRDGIGPKDPVALFLGESVRYLIHYIALTKIGAIPVFLNSALPPEIAAKFIANVGAVAVVCDGRLVEEALDVARYDADPYATGPFRAFTHADNDPVLIAHTSGTTGVPKAVQFNHAGFFFGIRQQINADLGRRILSALPQSHASAISVLMSCVARGSRVLLATEREPEQLAKAVEGFRPELVAAFPKVFVDLCRLDLESYDFGSVSRWMSTGDANHERHIRRLVRLGHHLDRSGKPTAGSLFIDNFGSSEFGFAMFRQVHSAATNRYGRCIGRPFDWIDARVFDDTDQPAAHGTVGRLALKSPTVTAGYWNNSLLSEKNRVQGYWLTGDLAYRDEDGRFYHVDRTSDSISTERGTIYSCQLEELILRQIPEVFDCSLVTTGGTAEGTAGEPRHLVLTVDLPSADADLGALRTRINAALSRAGFPVVDRLVRKTADEHVGVTGKALKRTMRDAYQQV
ncbi:class I adenylate-forming enzyme family protein [Streptomyces sp. NPDC048650]|uniref:class I adenylate-forming enzyme family protein n=1 Tax=Streptomyces sp. NPDC048650 TaxID=3365583 RepID=UPI003723D67A